jgi:ABC-2 type transport system ATP-binding protein
MLSTRTFPAHTDHAHAHSPPGPIVEATGIEKRYGATTVLHGVSFSVRRGELFGLLGTNGAGKTTMAEILQGLRRADAGSARVVGLDPTTAGDRLRRRIGAQLQEAVPR